jgi:hypothetical protein
MTLHDPLWTSMNRIQERAEEHARRREIVRLLDRPSGWSRIEAGIGSLLIAVADRIHALGCRLADACSCGCAETSVQPGA